MKRKKFEYRTRIILGYKCRLVFDINSECYLITCDKFPRLMEDGMDAKQATIRMRCNIARHIRKLQQQKKEIPPVDDPEWERTLQFTGHFDKEENE